MSKQEQWGVIEVEDDYGKLLEVHVVPLHDDLDHYLYDCPCQPVERPSEQTGNIPVYVHNVIYYN